MGRASLSQCFSLPVAGADLGVVSGMGVPHAAVLVLSDRWAISPLIRFLTYVVEIKCSTSVHLSICDVVL